MRCPINHCLEWYRFRLIFSILCLLKQFKTIYFLLVHKPELIEPTNKQLFNRLDTCNTLFKDGKIYLIKFSI
jgi:hypothetical protein